MPIEQQRRKYDHVDGMEDALEQATKLTTPRTDRVSTPITDNRSVIKTGLTDNKYLEKSQHLYILKT